jgi:hypothetical protein
MGKLLNTTATALYINETHKKPIKEATLNSFRSLGGGPIFGKNGKNILYDTDDVDAWIAESGPMKKYRSTSEYPDAFRKKKTPKPNGAPPEDKPSDPSPDDGEGE